MKKTLSVMLFVLGSGSAFAQSAPVFAPNGQYLGTAVKNGSTTVFLDKNGKYGGAVVQTITAWRSSTRMDNKPSGLHIGERARLKALVKPVAVMAIVLRSPIRVTGIVRPTPTRVTDIMARITIPATAIDRHTAITMASVIIIDDAGRRDAIIAPSSSIF